MIDVHKIKTVLMDLDGTLITLNWKKNKNLYYSKLRKILKEHGLRPTYFLAVKRAGNKLMKDRSGDKVNLETYFMYLNRYTSRRISDETNRELYWGFYDQVFSKFRMDVTEEESAHELLSFLKKKFQSIVLSTNPVFPLSAVKERLRWGNVDPDIFDHITHIENSHYCKPDKNYFREILSTMNAKPEECLMVGDDYQWDILPASELGMQVWWCKPKWNPFYKKVPQGTLTELLAELKKQ